MNGKEMEQLEVWEKLIKPLFPPHAEINTGSSGLDYYIDIQWHLGSDPNRPNKLSRMIKIQITHEAMKDYLDSDSKQRSERNKKFEKYIEDRKKQFNPEHDSPAGQTPPEEIWTITSSILN